MKSQTQLTAEKETLFLTLYGKALDYRSKNSILNDSYADEIVQKVGIDFTKFSDSNNRIIAVRARPRRRNRLYFS